MCLQIGVHPLELSSDQKIIIIKLKKEKKKKKEEKKIVPLLIEKETFDFEQL